MHYLYGGHDQSSPSDEIRMSKCSVDTIIRRTVEIGREFCDRLRASLSEFSPLELDWLYRTAATLIYLQQESNGAPFDDGVMHIKNVLKQVNARWRAAGSSAV
ncbi:hypothetical protein N7474_008152 [Penicillium riverlandense]|uniref:uncharacterized protein n=1 Tax=Penicillium riverlandense TaxID=1903569 RepID=UPI00254784CC|nr:uncharacterized protein N7474_008152 [Penicillium riverlandense]KAJ5811851.1 hypothetical protein N7474_008152 [Penicillium riverlandense]